VTVILMAALLNVWLALSKMRDTPLGFDPNGLVAWDLARSHPDSSQWHDTRLRLLPEYAAMSSDMPYGDGTAGYQIYSVRGVDVGRAGLLATAHVIRATPSFVDVLALKVVQGRPLESLDTVRRLVCIIDEAAASRLWPDGDSVGREIVIEQDAFVVVGTFSPFYRRPGALRPAPQIIAPLSVDQPARWVSVRGEAHVAEVASRLRGSEVARVDLERVVANRFAREDKLLLSVMLLCLLATALLSVQTATSTVFQLVTRRRAIALQMALGATQLRVVRTQLYASLSWIGGGIVVGGLWFDTFIGNGLSGSYAAHNAHSVPAIVVASLTVTVITLAAVTAGATVIARRIALRASILLSDDSTGRP
jgi:hypothetical protein